VSLTFTMPCTSFFRESAGNSMHPPQTKLVRCLQSGGKLHAVCAAKLATDLTNGPQKNTWDAMVWRSYRMLNAITSGRWYESMQYDKMPAVGLGTSNG